MKRLFVIALLATGAHYGWSFAAPPIQHYFLDAAIRDMSEKGRLLNQPEMLGEILRVIEEKRIPLTAKDVRFKRDGNRIRISVAYDQTVAAPFYSKTYHFESSHGGIYEPRR